MSINSYCQKEHAYDLKDFINFESIRWWSLVTMLQERLFNIKDYLALRREE